MKRLIAALALATAAAPAAAQAPVQAPVQAPLKLWRLDCGDFVMKRFGAWFSDTFRYAPGARPLVGSCYLIKHGNDYLLWDTGVPDSLVGSAFENADQRITLKRSVVDQLAEIGVKPEQIGRIGISHWHFDHVGQASRFPQARLLIGKEDIALLRGPNPPDEDSVKALAHWLEGAGEVEEVSRDKDIFGDGSAVMIRLPGHTPGHYALLVRLASGPVLLSGDQYHFTEAVTNRGVPSFNADRADTLASHDRFDRIAANTGAKVVIQHEPADIAKLPAFPQAAE